jgi:hypothetical protein
MPSWPRNARADFAFSTTKSPMARICVIAGAGSASAAEEPSGTGIA